MRRASAGAPTEATLEDVRVVSSEETAAVGARARGGGDDGGSRRVEPEPVGEKTPSSGADVARAMETETETDEEEEEEWFDIVRGGMHKFWSVVLGVVLIGASAWMREAGTGDGRGWKYAAIAAGVLVGRTFARGFVVAVIYVLENVLPLDMVAYYFDALSPALTTLIWYAGVSVEAGLLFSRNEIGRDEWEAAMNVVVLIGLYLLARCFALLIVKILTARLHAGTFWEQLKSTVRHEVLFKSLTGAPVRPRPNRYRPIKHSASFSKLKSLDSVKRPPGGVRHVARTDSDASDSHANAVETSTSEAEQAEQLMKDIHETLSTKVDAMDAENDAWQQEETNIRVAAEQAAALIKTTTQPEAAGVKNEFSFFSTLSMFKPPKSSSYMARFSATDQVLERAKTTVDAESMSSETDAEMRKAARMIFNHIRRPGEKFITKDAIRDFLPKKDIDEAFDLLSGQDHFEFPTIGLTDLCRGIRKMFDERYLLGQTLQSMQGLAESLGRSLQGLFFFIVCIIGMFLFKLDVANMWLLFSSSVLALTFIFGSSASRAFEAAVMIFAVSPFNIGDWIVIDGNNYKVIELGIHATKLLDLFNELTYMPTSQIASKTIVNLTRSPEVWMVAGVEVDMGVTQSQCKHLESICTQFMATDRRNYGSSCRVILRGLRERLKVRLDVIYDLAFNGSQRLRMLEAQSRMIFVVQQALVDMGVAFTGTDGMIFCHNPSSLGDALDKSTLRPSSPATGVPVGASAPTSAPATTPLRVDVAKQVADPFGRYPPHSSYWRSAASGEPYAITSNLRHVSGMLKMD